MKKLLSMLGTITLIGTASTSVIACNSNVNNNYFKSLFYFSYIHASINADKNNNIYVSDLNSGDIFKYDQHNKIKKIGNTFGPTLSNFIFDKENNVYFGNVHGKIFKYNAKLNTISNIYEVKDKTHGIDKLCIDKTNDFIYFLHNSIIYKYEIKNQICTKIIDLSNENSVKSLNIDKDGNIYMGGRGVVYKYDTSLKKLAKINVIGYINTLIIDNDNNIYVGQEYGSVIINKISSDFLNCSYLPLKITYSNLIVNENNIYISNNNKIYKIINKNKENNDDDKSLEEIFDGNNKIIFFIFGDNKKFYVSTKKEIFVADRL